MSSSSGFHRSGSPRNALAALPSSAGFAAEDHRVLATVLAWIAGAGAVVSRPVQPDCEIVIEVPPNTL